MAGWTWGCLRTGSEKAPGKLIIFVMFFGDFCFSVVDVCSSQSHYGTGQKCWPVTEQDCSSRRKVLCKWASGTFWRDPQYCFFDCSTENCHLSFFAVLQGKLLKAINNKCVLVLEQRSEWSWIKGHFALELNGTLENAYLVCIVQTWDFKVPIAVVRLDQRSRHKNVKNDEIVPDIGKICFWIL